MENITVRKWQWYCVCCHCDYTQADDDLDFQVANVADTELELLTQLRGEATYDDIYEIDELIERIGKVREITYELLKPIPWAEIGHIFYSSEDPRYYAIGKNWINSTVNASYANSYRDYFKAIVNYV